MAWPHCAWAASQGESKKPEGQKEQTGANAEAKEKEDTKKEEAEQKLPVVLFFITDASSGPLKSTGCMMAVMGAVGRVEARLRKDVRRYKGIQARAEVVFREKDIDRRLRAAVRGLRLPKKERSEGAIAAFLRCQGAVREPEKKTDSPKAPHGPRRFQAEVKVECEVCRVTLARKRAKKKKVWGKTLEATYITPKEQPEGQRLETENTAMQNAADLVIEKFFAKRKKWMK